MITNLDNGKVYVGQTVRSLSGRWNEHVRSAKAGSNSLICSAIRKYGVDSFSIEVLEECVSIEHLNKREVYWIAHYNSCHGSGYNLEEGGRGGVPGLEARRKMSESATGRKHSEETKIKMSKRMIGNKYALGSRCSDELKRQNAERAKGNKYALGNRHTEETKRKISKSQFKPVNQYDMGGNFVATYPSIKAAAKAVDGKRPAISMCCRGVKKKSHRGFVWRFVEKVSNINGLP